jgi:hypothetical protein
LPDGGKRLMWPTQPMGEVTTAADVDSSSRIIRIRQALQPDNFSRATIGKWTKNDVLSNFGKPVEKVYFPLMQREAWSYRFRNGSWYEMYHFYFDHDGVLQLTQETMDLYHDQSPTDAF